MSQLSRLLGKDSRDNLRRAIFEKRAPCEGSRRSNIRYWWDEYAPRWPKWGVDIYHVYTPEEDADDEYLFTLNNIGFIDSLIVPRVIKWSDRPLRAERYYWWSDKNTTLNYLGQSHGKSA